MMLPDDFEHFCNFLTGFEVARQEAFEMAWNDGDIAMMVALCTEHQKNGG